MEMERILSPHYRPAPEIPQPSIRGSNAVTWISVIRDAGHSYVGARGKVYVGRAVTFACRGWGGLCLDAFCLNLGRRLFRDGVCLHIHRYMYASITSLLVLHGRLCCRHSLVPGEYRASMLASAIGLLHRVHALTFSTIILLRLYLRPELS